MNRQRIRMVCFDIGGVLVKHCRTWREGCAAAGLPIRDGSESEHAARQRKELAAALTCGKISPQAFYERMASTTAGLYTPGEIERIHHVWLGPEYDDVGPVVRRLVQAARAQTGVLSNTNGPHWSRFSPRDGRPPEFPTASLLTHRFASHELGMMKPSPEIYAEFERRTGFAGPDILFLEDLPENAAQASARGWQIELIDHTRPTADQIEAALQRHDLI